MSTYSLPKGSTDGRIQRRLQFVLESNNQMAYEQNRALRYTWVANPLFGGTAAEWVGCVDADVLEDTAAVAALQTAKRHVLTTGTPVHRSLPLSVEGQSQIYVVTATPLYEDDDSVSGVRGIVRAAPDASEHDVLMQRDRLAAEQARDRAQDAQAEAEDAHRALSMVLGNASHALLTPLSGMMSLVDAMRARNIEAIEQPLNRLRTSGERLERAIRRLLDLSALEAGRADLEPEPIDVRSEVEESVALLRTQATRKGLQLHIDMPDVPVQAYRDASAVRRISQNLIGNAVKYTETGHVRVCLTIEDAGATVCLVVSDTGPGISPSFLPSIFEPFSRGTHSNLSRTGTGLGMAVTKRLIDAMNGSIEIDTSVGNGTTFTVRLPAHPL
mgnify:CR=1 FL=1